MIRRGAALAVVPAACLCLAMAAVFPPNSSAQDGGAPEEVPWLDTVVVSATRTPEALRDLPVRPVIIDSETISRRPAADLGDLLEAEGILIDRQYRLGGQVTLRGLSGNISGSDVQSDVLMLFNGHRVGRANMLRFPSKNIERVEILRGPAALQFGSAAMGGVVNVITRRGEGDFSFLAEAGAGSFGLYNDNVALSGEKYGFDYSFGIFQMAQEDFYDTGGGLEYLGTDIGLKVESSVNLGYTFAERHRLGVIYNIVEVDRYGFTGSIYDMRTRAVGAGGVLADEPNYEHKTTGHAHFVDLSYSGSTVGGLLSWSGKYFFGRDVQTEGFNVNVPLRNAIKGAQAQLTGDFPSIGASVTVGFDWTSYDFTTESSNLSHYTYDDFGGFALAKLKLLDGRLVASGGARYNYFRSETELRGGVRRTGSEITPSVGLSYQATERLRLRTNLARGYRAPAATEMFGQGATRPGRYSVTSNTIGSTPVRTNTTAVWLIPNFALESQQSDSVELGADLEINGLTASLTAFYSKFDDKIELVETPYPVYQCASACNPYKNAFNGKNVGFPDSSGRAYVATAQYVNIGDAEISGLEWSAKWDLGEAFGWPFSISPYSRGTWILRAKYESGPEAGYRLRKVPRLYASNGLEVEVPAIDLWLDLNVLTKSSQRVTDMMMNDSHVSERQPGWTGANIRFRKGLWSFANGGELSLQGEISNVADVYYEVFPTYPLPGRAFFLGMRYDYN